jgi:hypothetical protein
MKGRESKGVLVSIPVKACLNCENLEPKKKKESIILELRSVKWMLVAIQEGCARE